MDNLLLDNKVMRPIRYGIGTLLILAATGYFLANRKDLDALGYVILISFFLSSLGHFTNDFGTNYSRIKVIGSSLEIKWFNTFRKKEVTAAEIKSILIKKDYLLIDRKDSKAIKLPVKNYEVAQRSSVFNLFRQFAEANGIGISHE
jgi:hypothetical protein